MTRRKSVLGLAVLALAVVAGLLTGCSSAKAYPDQCALIVGSGVGDAHKVKHVFLPGEKVSKGDDQEYFLPCGSRNFRVTDHNGGDATQPLTAMTGADGDSPALPVKITLSMYFTLNEDKQALQDFWTTLCRKYNCAATKANQGDQSSTSYSTSGWLGMLKENFPDALQRAAQQATSQFKPNLWQEQGQAQWPQLAERISQNFMTQIKVPTNAKEDFFCNTGSDFSDGKCNPVGVQIQSVQPADDSVKAIYNQGIQQDQQKALNDKRVAAAKKLYGDDWGYFLGLQDTIGKCQNSKTSCTIIVGNPPNGLTSK
jgi:predicted component of type VI protein secretion system